MTTTARETSRRPRRALSLRGNLGLVLLAVVTLIAFFGPLFAPHSPSEFVGVPFARPGNGLLFGTDVLGRDVFSRFLSGGRTVMLLSLVSTVVGVAGGVVVGATAAYFGGRIDEFTMRINDALLAFPQIILVMLLSIAGDGGMAFMLLGVALAHLPRSARLARGAILPVVESDYVKNLEMNGERRWRIMLVEILPNVKAPILADMGLRFTYSIGLIAGLSFLGLGVRPPAADWGLMINENRLGLTAQPWSVLLPVIAIAALTLGVNLVIDRATLRENRKVSGRRSRV